MHMGHLGLLHRPFGYSETENVAGAEVNDVAVTEIMHPVERCAVNLYRKITAEAHYMPPVAVMVRRYARKVDIDISAAVVKTDVTAGTLADDSVCVARAAVNAAPSP